MSTDYDSMANAYARNRTASCGVIDELRNHGGVGPEQRVLEVGCGTASHLVSLINVTGCRGWGVEPSSGMRHLARVHDRLELRAGFAEPLPFEGGFFDLAFVGGSGACRARRVDRTAFEGAGQLPDTIVASITKLLDSCRSLS